MSEHQYFTAKQAKDLQEVSTKEIMDFRFTYSMKLINSKIIECARNGLNRITIGPEDGTTLNLCPGNRHGNDLDKQLRNDIIAKLKQLGYTVKTENVYPGHKLTITW